MPGRAPEGSATVTISILDTKRGIVDATPGVVGVAAWMCPSWMCATGTGYGAGVRSGRLITIEGLDGAGKSTLAQALALELAARGLTVELLREPGGGDTAERN